MKRLAPLALLALPCLFTSCGLANGLMQGPYRLLQSAGRTITKVSEESPPAPDGAASTLVALQFQAAH